MSYADSLIAYARSFFGTWYRYGGKSRYQGSDCSGFVCDVLRRPGIIGLQGEYSAQTLFDTLNKMDGCKSVEPPFPTASILFFGASNKQIHHVAISTYWNEMIECGGGEKTTTSFDEAARLNAGVREIPISARKNLVAAIKPQYPDEK